MKKRLNDKIDDVPDTEQINALKKQLREQEIAHNDAL